MKNRHRVSQAVSMLIIDTGNIFAADGHRSRRKKPCRRSAAKMLTKDEAQIAVLTLSFILQLRFVLNPIITARPAD